MRVEVFAALLAPLALAGSARAINIVSSNDDGWAEVNIRAFYEVPTAGGHSVVVAAPAENQSGTGQLQDLSRASLVLIKTTDSLQQAPFRRHPVPSLSRVSSTVARLEVQLWHIMLRILVSTM